MAKIEIGDLKPGEVLLVSRNGGSSSFKAHRVSKPKVTMVPVYEKGGKVEIALSVTGQVDHFAGDIKEELSGDPQDYGALQDFQVNFLQGQIAALMKKIAKAKSDKTKAKILADAHAKEKAIISILESKVSAQAKAAPKGDPTTALFAVPETFSWDAWAHGKKTDVMSISAGSFSVPSKTFSLHANGGGPSVVIKPSGEVELAPGVSISEAARLFWDSVSMLGCGKPAIVAGRDEGRADRWSNVIIDEGPDNKEGE